MPMVTYLTLFAAITLEVIGTVFLQRNAQFTLLWRVLIVVIAYAGSFYFLSLVLRTMPLGTAYAIWSGLGIVLISLIGFGLFGQKLDMAAIIGLSLIIAGVLVVNLFSDNVTL